MSARGIAVVITSGGGTPDPPADRAPSLRFASLVIAIVAMLALVSVDARADSLSEIWQRANAAYFRGEYDSAARDYRRLLQAGVVDADVTYNLALAEARLGHHGAAIQLFERTLWLRPGDDDAERGLDAVRSALGRRRAQARGEAEVDAGPPVGDAIYAGVSADALAIVALAFELLFFGVIIGLLVARRESVRLALGIAAVVSGLGLAVSGFGVLTKSGALDEGEPAIVLSEGVLVREGPDRHARERHRALEGQRAWVLERDRGWSHVRIPSLGEGWMQSDDVGAIRAR